MVRFWALLSDGIIMTVIAKDIDSAPRKIGNRDVIGLGNGYGVIRSLREVLHSKDRYIVDDADPICFNTHCRFFDTRYDFNCTGWFSGEPAIASCKDRI